MHGPLLSTPALFDEAPFLRGLSESRGHALGMQWLPLELALLGPNPWPHRLFALLLEVALVALVAFAPAVRRSAAPNLALVAFAAFLVHPFRTESFVRLGARPILVSEALLAGGLLLASWPSALSAATGGTTARERTFRVAGLALAAAGASGQPLAAAFALPLLAPTSANSATSASATRGRLVALALVLGAAFWWVAPTPAAPLASALCGLDRLARPWTTALAHADAAPVSAAVGGGLLLLMVVLARALRDRVALAAVLAAAVAFAAAPALRPPRTGLDLLGVALTPEAWLPALALLLAALLRLAIDSGFGRGLLLAFVALAVGGGAAHAWRDFDDEAALLDRTIEQEPRLVEPRVLRAELLLRDELDSRRLHGDLPSPQRRDFATEALHAAQQARQARPGDVAATLLESLAFVLLDRLDDARATSDRLLAQRRDDWRALEARAELESAAGDDLVAAKWLRSALDARPDSPFLRSRWTALVDRAYEELRRDLADRRFDDARRRCVRLLEVAPEELDARTTIVDTFTLEGNLPRALLECERLQTDHPRDRRVLQRLASLNERLGRADVARDLERQLLALPPESTTAASHDGR